MYLYRIAKKLNLEIMKERWYLRSSGERDYFRILTEESEKTIAYINITSIQFNDMQIEMQNIVSAHNISLK